MNANVIARKLELLQEKAAMRSVDVANVLGTRPETVSRWNQGRAFPRSDTQRKLIDLIPGSSARWNTSKPLCRLPKAVLGSTGYSCTINWLYPNRGHSSRSAMGLSILYKCSYTVAHEKRCRSCP